MLAREAPQPDGQQGERLGELVHLLDALHKGARLDQVQQHHEGHAHEHHGDGEAPVRDGDVQLRDAKDGLPRQYHGYIRIYIEEGLTVTNVSGKKSMLIMVRMRMLSPWSIARRLSLMELPLNS